MLLTLDLGMLTCLSITLVLYYSIYKVATRKATAYDVLPWAGLPDGPLARVRGYLFSGGGRDRLLKAYKEHSLQGRCFVWQELRQAPVVVLPPSQTTWVLEQPESVICNRTFFNDRQHARSSLADGLPWDPIHVDVIRTDLTRHLNSAILAVVDEVKVTLDEHLGSSEQWHSTELRKVMADVAIRVFNRSFAGVELARNEEVKHHLVKFASVALGTAARLHACPAFLRPLLGFFVLRPNRHHWKAIAAQLLPIIKRRKDGISQRLANPEASQDQPHDALQWLIRASLDSHDPANARSATICTRYIFTGVASVHSTAIAATQTIFYLAGTPPELRAMEILREEISRVRESHCPDGRWTQAALSQLVHLDSAIRESLRIGVRSGTTASRAVVAKDGVTLNDGTILPHGTHIALHALGAHFLNRKYADPLTYDPWRFLWPQRNAEGVATIRGEKKGLAAGSEMAASSTARTPNVTAATTSAEFLTFGLGRHACPGRFFVVAELKLILIELLMHYEIQALEKPPPMGCLGTPGFDAKLVVRKPPTLKTHRG